MPYVAPVRIAIGPRRSYGIVHRTPSDEVVYYAVPARTLRAASVRELRRYEIVHLATADDTFYAALRFWDRRFLRRTEGLVSVVRVGERMSRTWNFPKREAPGGRPPAIPLYFTEPWAMVLDVDEGQVAFSQSTNLIRPANHIETSRGYATVSPSELGAARAVEPYRVFDLPFRRGGFDGRSAAMLPICDVVMSADGLIAGAFVTQTGAVMLVLTRSGAGIFSVPAADILSCDPSAALDAAAQIRGSDVEESLAGAVLGIFNHISAMVG